ncbi:SIS domain-containing protein [Virgibacillus sp. JSM 102003]|uniref:SIS domain-containing protein n=1 Tax=Virgibacillus sp. JSM 102003 TaxID=1562108 RepID=UPI0035BFB858
MFNFDENIYLKNGELTYQTRDTIEQIAHEVHEEGYENIFFISVGGSIAIMWPIQEMLNQITDVPVYAEQAAEIVLKGHQKLSEKSIVITASKSGTTKETVKAAEWCKNKGYRTVSLIGKEGSPLEKASTWTIPNLAENGVEFEYMQLLLFVFKLLELKNDFPQYERFATQIEHLPKNLLNAKKKFETRANEIAKKYYQEPYNIWVGSGEMWGEVYLFSMCILEEMQWIRTKSVPSPEFFHGTLELVEEDVPVFLVKGEGKCRFLDDRVEKFCKRFTKKLEVIDTKDFELKNIDDEFRWILAPTISTSLLVDRLAKHYEYYTGHKMEDTRYYRKIDY